MNGFEETGLKWHQFDHSPGEFVQIHFVSDRNRRIAFTRSHGGDKVHVYDPLNRYGQE